MNFLVVFLNVHYPSFMICVLFITSQASTTQTMATIKFLDDGLTWFLIFIMSRLWRVWKKTTFFVG